MEVRYPPQPEAVKHYSTEQLRRDFLISSVFADDEVKLVYSHVDRMIVGGALPVRQSLVLTGDPKELGAEFFLQRRELGIVNVGGDGRVIVDGTTYPMQRLDGLYVGQSTQTVCFESESPEEPARFYLASTPAHMAYPTVHIPLSSATPAHLGSISNSNERTINKYIHPDGVKSCQLVLGVTLLEPNNMWNSMPAHTHTRRSEIYFYFDVPENNFVVHLLGEPQETRHIIIRNEQAVISPSWSLHAGMGTSNYGFIWAMGGENQTFSDMDAIPMSELL